MKRNDDQTKDWVLEGLTGYTITLSNVPNYAIPKIIDPNLTNDEKNNLSGMNKDGNIGIITSLVGNLVFYDSSNLELEINSFPSPIQLTYNFTANDEKQRAEHKRHLKKDQRLGADEDVDLIPVFLYFYDSSKKKLSGEQQSVIFKVWQPFQHFTLDKEQTAITVEFQFWGDQNIGFGTRP